MNECAVIVNVMVKSNGIHFKYIVTSLGKKYPKPL